MQTRARRIFSVLVVVSALQSIPVSSVSADGEAAPSRSSGHKVSARAIGTISIPKLNVRQPILTGITNAVFDKGVGYWPGTALPGQLGNMVLGGHRTAGVRPFYDIQKLVPGDPIIITRGGREYTYIVDGSKIVRPTATWILNQTPDSTLTIFSCHPRGTVRQRYVVTATLQS